MPVSPTERWKLKGDEVAWREVGEEIVILHLGSATYLSLNGSGRLLWLRLIDGASRDELAGLLTENYGIDEDQAGADTSAFLDNLDKLGLLLMVS
ncbi:MAG: PqqD family protein [Actinomycetota bacterium]|nr:PqqD family protein [Actinomycetota bacterium]